MSAPLVHRVVQGSIVGLEQRHAPAVLQERVPAATKLHARPVKLASMLQQVTVNVLHAKLDHTPALDLQSALHAM